MISTWTDLAIVFGLFGTFSGIIGSLIRSKIEKRTSDAAASDRLIVLIEREADKRVGLVRTEFQLKLADLELAHRDEIALIRKDFENQIKKLKTEHDTHRCELAQVCSWRNSKLPPPVKKTD